MRLNLARYHCSRFEMRADISCSSDSVTDILNLMKQTYFLHPDEEENDADHLWALFGSKYSYNGNTYQATGNLDKTQDGNEISIELSIEYRIAPEGLSRPPNGTKTISHLLDAAGDIFGDISATFIAVFLYDQEQGWKSKISFPIPLIIAQEDSGITHIENAQFSRRTSDDDAEYTIGISNLDDYSLISHSVRFESTLNLSRRSLRDMLGRAQSISTQLVGLEGDN